MFRGTGSWRDFESELICWPLEIFAILFTFICGQKEFFVYVFVFSVFSSYHDPFHLGFWIPGDTDLDLSRFSPAWPCVCNLFLLLRFFIQT